MKEYGQHSIECPHCGNHTFIDVDISAGDQDEYQDCANCCNPIHIKVHINEVLNKVEIHIDADDEQIF